MGDLSKLREDMVENQVAARQVTSEAVLRALRKVPREAFLPERLREFAYEDSPLPIAEGQTISQPYIVALMTEALDLKGGERVLEIGTGSGYAAAVLGEIAAEVYTIERIGQLAEKAASALKALGYRNVHVVHADGTLGWAAAAPYDAIIVAAGGPEVPESLKEQLKIGGRLVIPIGTNPRAQELVRVTRTSSDKFLSEDIADVRFVPLIGKEGWAPEELPFPPGSHPTRLRLAEGEIVRAIKTFSEPFPSIDEADLDPLLDRIGDAKIVLLGEATHGTSEFYRMRARISQALITRKGFRFVAIEGDWPDVARLDHYVRHFEYPPSEWTAFARFPTWMWRNNEMRAFVDWLHAHNAKLAPRERIAIYGLDLYSLYTSIASVLKYLDEVDPESARIARQRYGCLTPWQSDPATYGHATLTGAYRTCEGEVVRMLEDILHKQSDYAAHDGERFMDAVQNARSGHGRRALLPDHVLRKPRLLESARRSYVRNAENPARLSWRECQSHRLGPQFPRRRRRRDGDVRARRAQYRATLPRRIRRGRLFHRVWNRFGNCRGGFRLGRGDAGQEGAAFDRAKL